jgi:Polymer-forming cytoskeletal
MLRVVTATTLFSRECGRSALDSSHAQVVMDDLHESRVVGADRVGSAIRSLGTRRRSPTPSLLGALGNGSAGRRGLPVTIIGELWTEGDVQIDGHLSGNFNCAQLVVGRDADITGDIIAKEVVVRGGHKHRRCALLSLFITAR